MSSEEQTDVVPVTTEVIEEEIARFVTERTGTTPAAGQDLFATGLATSMFAMQLVVFLEKTYSVAVAGQDLQLPNFRTVKNMAALVRRLRAEEAADSDV